MNHKQTLFSSGEPYISQRGNTLTWPEKQHWFVLLLNFFSGWISSKPASVSMFLVHGFCISREKFCQEDFCFILWCKNSYSPLSQWWSSSWSLLAEGPLILALKLWSIFFCILLFSFSATWCFLAVKIKHNHRLWRCSPTFLRRIQEPSRLKKLLISELTLIWVKFFMHCNTLLQITKPCGFFSLHPLRSDDLSSTESIISCCTSWQYARTV